MGPLKIVHKLDNATVDEEMGAGDDPESGATTQSSKFQVVDLEVSVFVCSRAAELVGTSIFCGGWGGTGQK